MSKMTPDVLLVIAIAAIGAWSWFRAPANRPWRIRRSKRLLTQLRSFESPQQVFAYLRKIDPFLFEELLLTCFEERGLVIKRNRRYTGDGGSDGQVYIDGLMMHVQAKRYQNHIKVDHVREFLRLVNNDRTKGIFIHTGRTGKAARTLFAADALDCVSGDRLIALLKGQPLKLHGVTLAGAF